MEITTLLAVLVLATFAAVIAFAVISKRRTEQLIEDDDAPKSTLAKDGPDR